MLLQAGPLRLLRKKVSGPGGQVEAVIKSVEALPRLTRFGRVARMEGLLVEVTGAAGAIGMGGHLHLSGVGGEEIPCEVVGFRDGCALAMPFGRLDGIALGARATFEEGASAIYPSEAWLGRVIDAFGRAIDGKAPLADGMEAYALRAAPIPAHARSR